MGKTIAEKILSHASGRPVAAGDVAICRVDAVMVHDSNGPTTIKSFHELGAERVWAPERVAMVIDHFAPCPTAASANMHQKMRAFAAQYGVRLYDLGNGVCHQVMCESGLVRPGTLVIGTDSHSCMYGALNSFGTGFGSTEAASVLAYGQSWFRVPESIRVELQGELRPGVSPKDIILYLLGRLTVRGAIYRALEFGGPGLRTLSVEGRITVANMAVEAGAKAGLMEPDDKLAAWISRRTGEPWEAVSPDPGAGYSDRLVIDLGKLEPQVAKPHSVDNVAAVSQVTGTSVQQVFLGSCTNGRAEDFRRAAAILRGRKVHPGVRMIAQAASRTIYAELLADGTLQDLLEAGVVIPAPGCGPCAGYQGGILGDGEACLATTNRNFQGRMGNEKAEIYLASPETAAATALAGVISDAREVGGSKQ